MPRPWKTWELLVGRGATVEPSTIPIGTAGQILTQVATGADPAFAAPATVNLTSGVTGILPVANGGTGQAVGAPAIMQFAGTAVPAGATHFLGRTNSATETDVQFTAPVDGTLLRFDTKASTAPVGAETFIYRLFVAGGLITPGHTVTGANTTGASTPNAALTKGQSLSFRVVTSAGAAVASHMVTAAIRVDG